MSEVRVYETWEEFPAERVSHITCTDAPSGVRLVLADAYDKQEAELESLRGSLDEWKADFKAIEAELAKLRTERERLIKRDGNATIEMTYNDGDNPFARQTLNVVDFGVADNIYVVECAALQTTQQEDSDG